MFLFDRKYGSLLLSVASREVSVLNRWMPLLFPLVLAARMGLEYLRHPEDRAFGIPGGTTVLVFGAAMLYRTAASFRSSLRFYDSGLLKPMDSQRDSSGSRFLCWHQIDRYYWDGDILNLVGTESTLKGGPVPGGRYTIPAERRAEVQSLLSLHVGAAR
jgi:hypothetical protein